MSNIMNPIDDPSYNVDATEQAFGTNSMESKHSARSLGHAHASRNPYSSGTQPMDLDKPQTSDIDGVHPMAGTQNPYNAFGASTARPLSQEMSTSSTASPIVTLGPENGRGFQDNIPHHSAPHGTFSPSTNLDNGATQSTPTDRMPSSTSPLGSLADGTDTARAKANRGSVHAAQYSTGPSAEISGGGRHTSDQLSPSNEHHLEGMSGNTDSSRAEINHSSTQAGQMGYHKVVPDDGTAGLKSGNSASRGSHSGTESQKHDATGDAVNASAGNRKERMEGTLDSDLNGEKVNGIAGVIPISGNAGPTTTKTFDPHATVGGGSRQNIDTRSSTAAKPGIGEIEPSRDNRAHSSDIAGSSYNTRGHGSVQSTTEPVDSQAPGKNSAGMTSGLEGSEPLGSQRPV
ncbi:hypothetical protein ASPACDRAFT_110960 [Aspergillus aculeatus ATCC 16872]|uniref:Uncharacterized protein n=1 Tax=Aspergillus aculeatus (strain ATCC 16872 / CBS 172.66 / WB 5094) TaxID=690307 RepID=A0A1L9X4S9_ASPA1|nr:uncharacterized protein ASPACDRAFT_110960 [Aspergillus aculeatus ATCC 16872]OJK03329.1 hypothetical protein ASPACDRAFT_110960 [Aspergillus aculeatus ATCC 16872]